MVVSRWGHDYLHSALVVASHFDCRHFVVLEAEVELELLRGVACDHDPLQYFVVVLVAAVAAPRFW